MAGNEVSDGELEDGEVLSSEEEGEGNTKDQLQQNGSNSTLSLDESHKEKPKEERKESRDKNHDNKPAKKETKDSSRSGEIYSDDEEAAYYPQRVKSRQSQEKSPLKDSPQTSQEQFSSLQKGSSPHHHHRWSSPERGGARKRDSYENRRRFRRNKFRSSDNDQEKSSEDQDSSWKRSSDRDRDSSTHSREFYSSPSGSRYSGGKDGGWRDSGRSSDSDSDTHHHGNHYGSRGNRTRRFGGYGQTHNYQHRPGGKFNRASGGRGSNYGGYSNRYFPSGSHDHKNSIFNEDVVGRLQKGLSLLPPPKEPQCDNLDQFNYPAPPSWYLKEVEEWQKREEEAATQAPPQASPQVPPQVPLQTSPQVPPQVPLQTSPQALSQASPQLPPQAPPQAAPLELQTPPTSSYIPIWSSIVKPVPSSELMTGVVPNSGMKPHTQADTLSPNNPFHLGLNIAHPISEKSLHGHKDVTERGVIAEGSGVGVAANNDIDSVSGEVVTDNKGARTEQLVGDSGHPTDVTPMDIQRTDNSKTALASCSSVHSEPPMSSLTLMTASVPPTSCSTVVPVSCSTSFMSVQSSNVSVSSSKLTEGNESSIAENGGDSINQAEHNDGGVIADGSDQVTGEGGGVSGDRSDPVSGEGGGVIGDRSDVGGGVIGDRSDVGGGVIGDRSDVGGGMIGDRSDMGGGVIGDRSDQAMCESGIVIGDRSDQAMCESGIVSGDKSDQAMCEGGGVSGDREVVSDKPLIEKVNPREQLILLSEITRVQVYVAPVTSNEETRASPVASLEQPQMAASQMAPPSQNAPLPLSQVAPLAIQDMSSLPVAEPPLPSTTPTLDSLLALSAPVDPSTQPSVTTGEHKESKETSALTEEDEEPVIYSLRSKGKGNRRKRAGHSLKKPAVVRPKLHSESDTTEVNYDDYLDQLLEEEEEEEAPGKNILEISSLSGGQSLLGAGQDVSPSLDDQLSQGFLGGPSGSSNQTKGESLHSLIGRDLSDEGDGSSVGPDKSVKSSLKRKSARRRMKESAWWSKQKEMDQHAVEVDRVTRSKAPCKYYLNGFCKNGDSCDFSHDGVPTKKMGVCKFYVMDNCNKGDDCIYYHNDFPCKFFHTKSYCKNGDHCKFSHDPLTPVTRDLLLSVTDLNILSPVNLDLVVSIPKDIVREPLTVSIPLCKLEDRIRLKSFSIPKLKPSSSNSNSIPSQNHLQMGTFQSQGPFQFQQVQNQVPTPVLNIPIPNQSQQPVPLFPPKDSSAHFIPSRGTNILPPRPAPPIMGVVPSVTVPPIGEHPQRKVLLPTPPPNLRLLPDDFKKMKSFEYWEDAMVSQQVPPGPPQVSFPLQGPPLPPGHKEIQDPHQSVLYHGPPPAGNPVPNPNQIPTPRMENKPGLDPRQSRKEEAIQYDPQSVGGKWQPNQSYPPHDQRFGTTGDHHQLTPYPQARLTPYIPTSLQPPHQAQTGEFKVPPLTGQSDLQVKKSSPVWGGNGRSPDQRSPISYLGVARREGEGRRVDPRTKYAHFKIKSKGGVSPNQSSSSILKRPQEDSTNASFKIPKLLQDSTALEKPMDPQDLFKGGLGSSDIGYKDIPAPGMFKSSFFSRSQTQDDRSEDTKQPFGEITMKAVDSSVKDLIESKVETLTTGGGLNSDIRITSEDIKKEDLMDMPPKPEVPSYFASLDMGVPGNDLKIDSAFGSLAGKTESGCEEGGSSEDKQKDSPARKLPSMFGLGF